MRLIVSFTIFSFVTDIGRTDSTTDAQGGVAHALVKPDVSAPYAEVNHILNTLWLHNPLAQTHLSAGSLDGSRRVQFRKPYSIPKLSKTLSNGIDPFFNMAVFEPFERRPKPITLVAFRKKGYFPRRNIAFPTFTSANSMEVAEQQSPYNDISSFWKDNPTDS